MQMVFDLETKKDGATKLFCLLSNIELSDSFMAKIYEELPPKLVKHKDMVGSDIYMALFSRETNDLLMQFMSYERETLWQQKNIKSLFLHTVLRKQHWVLALLDCNTRPENNFNVTLNQHIELFKLIAFCNSSLDNADLWLEFVSKVQKATNLSGVAYSDLLKICHLEVQRQALLLEFLQANSKFRKIGDVTMKFSILESLLEHVDFDSNNYSKIEQLLEQNHQFKMKQLSIHQNKVFNLTCQNSHLLREYYIVKLSLDLLMAETPTEANEQKIVSTVKLMFRNIDKVESFVRTVEIVFSLLFLRYEHIRKSKRGSNVEARSMTSSILTSPPTFYSQMSLSIKLDLPPQVGFVCSRRVLEIILNLLRGVCVQRKHSKPSQNCDDSIKMRLKTINDGINEGLWRLTLLPNKTKPSIGSGKITNFNYQLALKFHQTLKDGDYSSERTSEEDQLSCKVKKPFKRKLKKRVPRTSSDGGNEKSSMSVQTSNTDVSNNARDSGEFEDSSKARNIICRMLMSPKSLINISMDNPHAVEQIIEVISNIALKN